MSFSHLIKKTWWVVRPLKTVNNMGIHLQWEFKKILECECARAERTGSHFALVRFSTGKSKDSLNMLVKLIGLLKKRIRLTDDLGWLDDYQIGVLLYNTDAYNAIRFVTDMKDNGFDDISYFSYKIYMYPSDQQDNSDHHLGLQPKQKISNRQALHAKADDADGQGTGSETHPLPMDYTGTHRNVTIIGQNNSGSIKGLLLRVPLWKRLFDIVGAVVALAIFSPVFLILALCIKWVSPGPVFFKQERFGYGGRVFRMWKFRTMEVNACQGVHQQLIDDLLNNKDRPMNKIANDSRIIPSGNFLRKFCIDELPQLINVLKGEMSLVGPRPDPVYVIDNYNLWYTARFDAAPGMTGLWQVSGKNRLSFEQMMRLDIFYTRQRSLWLDLKILLSTVPAILWNAKTDA